MTCDISGEYGLGVDDGEEEVVDNFDYRMDDILNGSDNELMIDLHKFISFSSVSANTILFYDL